ncbi:hypothetical protein CBR_g44461 [Chara braunii]|uniref:HAT C-terminal dimerisation domain-containing protein n=1 Tax=Chara braunii TaxID=69332 RepID=A0A388LXG3_CHABU|nr:hypothetical protein CBR_g44461 [Chara braunii]|eukprot:GBG87007.1 hypothetical protein CBR_g44461 [Chara braunii]
MWSTVTPCERNWSTLDLVHEKRRNQLCPETINKLVYIHWNMQLTNVKKKKNKGGFIDLWASFFDDGQAPPLEDLAILPPGAPIAEGELVACDRLSKTPIDGVPKVGRLDESSCSDDSDDGEDLVWRGKGVKKRDEVVKNGKAPTVGEEEGHDRNGEEENMEQEEAGEEEEEKIDFGLRSYNDSDKSKDNNEIDNNLPNLHEFGYFDSSLRVGLDDDEAERRAAQALAQTDRAIVMQRMEQEAARRAALPRNIGQRGE